MDVDLISPAFDTVPADTGLSYDDTLPYEAQVPAAPSLANRISSTKVYLLSESSIGKRKHNEEDEQDEAVEDEVVGMEEDLSYRPTALTLQGPPISELPTARIFAYATHFDTSPTALEWVSDNTCVLVFKSRSLATSAYAHLSKLSESPDEEGFITAKPIPVALWPADKRISSSLGQGEGLKGTIRMRWAREEDKKKRGAKRESEFYRKHGETAGKELFNGRDLPPAKRRRENDEATIIDEDAQCAKLDSELDAFLAEDDEEPANPTEQDLIPPSPPSKMRSDYISNDGRTLLERTSLLRAHPDLSESDELSLVSRLTAPLPRRARGRKLAMDVELEDRISSKKLEWGRDDKSEWGREEARDRGRRRVDARRSGRGREDTGEVEKGERRRRGHMENGTGGVRERGERRPERPRKTQQELDDELDAFLNSGEP
ncbi:hypothetical protein BDQ12DRAFT_674335 [Crucibulum laeve]|uniref:Chromatin target of PRMT1 protein C-terminal domain-containing protein n=1 Tax=Crucibulum laeve TaxID=68775 RepID=A0A5C3MPE1_9AGAR|nr:hypothetical protein BDQ12DRAFT_674335 [Crucibulum laeve]